MFRFPDKAWKEENLETFDKMINDLKDTIPGIVHIETGINISKRDNAFDLVLTSDFESEEALEAYRVHPEHLKLGDYLKPTEFKTVVVDYPY